MLEAHQHVCGFPGVELGIGLPGLFLDLELFGTVIPVSDLLGKAIFDCRHGFGDDGNSGVANLGEVLGHNVGYGMPLSFLFEFAANPSTLRSGEDLLHVRFALGQRSVVEVGRVVHVPCRTIRIELDIEHPFGNDTSISRTGEARVLNCVVKAKQHAGIHTRITFIHQHGAALQKITMPFQRKIDNGVEQRLTWADKGGQRMTLRCDQRFFKRYALVARQYRLADANKAVAVSYRGRNMGDFIATWFALFGRSAKASEGFQKERFDIVRLQPSRLGPFHVFTNTMNAARVYGVVRKRPLLHKFLQSALVQRVFQHGCQARPHFRLIPVTDSLDQEIPKHSAFELEFAKGAEHLASERLTGLLQLLQELMIEIAFAGLISHQVPPGDGHTYSRFGSLGELLKKARVPLVEYIQRTFETEPTPQQTAQARETMRCASDFERQRVHSLAFADLDPTLSRQLVAVAEDRSPERLSEDMILQALAARGYLWFDAKANL